MNIISAASPRWANAAQTAIDLQIEVEGLGIIPFTATPTDIEAHGRELFALAVAGEFGPVAAFVPSVPKIPSTVNMRQARRALLDAGLLQTVDDAIAAMPGAEGDAARIDWEFAGTVERASPLVANLSAALGLSDPQLDALFKAAAGL